MFLGIGKTVPLFSAPLILGGLLLFGSLSPEAEALPVRYTCSLNWDGTCDTAFLAGDKPQPGASCTTWDCRAIGIAVGEIDEVSATELDLAVSSPNDWEPVVLGTKTFASGDIQVCADVEDQDDWTGYTENFTDFGVTVQETGDASGYWFFRVFLPHINDVPRRKFGTELANESEQCTAAVGAVTLCITYEEDTDTFQGWQSSNGVDFDTCGTSEVRESGSLDAGVWGTSQEAGQTSFATLTDVTATNTITVFTPAGVPEFTSGPTPGTPTESTIPISFTVNQTGSVVGVLCPNGQALPSDDQIQAGDCTNDIAAEATITQSVVEDVADSDTFINLSSNTTFDAHFIPISTNGVGEVASVDDITTDDDTPPVGESSCPLAPLGSPTNATINSAERETTDINCRTGDDIVAGRDLSTPPDAVIAPYGGLFDASNSLPNNTIKGNRLYHCKVQWDEVETSNDNGDPNTINAGGFDWGVIDDCFADAASSNHDGVMMHFRHTVVEIEDCTGNTPNGTPKHLSEWTAPAWAASIAALEPQGCHPQDFQVTNLNLDNATVRAEVKEFIRAFTNQNYKTRDNFSIVMHMASSSRGEECCAGTSEANMEDIINEWTSGMGQYAWKLAWLKEEPPEPAAFAIGEGTGMRGGIIENCLRIQYLPGVASLTGQLYDQSTGYLTISPNFGPIDDPRHWMDELEFHTLTEQAYFFCAFRAMQMRRNQMWITTGGDINHRLDDWMSTLMGHPLSERAEGWVNLIETRFGPVAGPRTLKNFESGIRQREALGATSPTHKIDHTEELTGNANFPATHANCNFGGNTNCRAATWARRENNASNIIGFSFDDIWWPTGLTHDAVVKATYYDNGSTTCRFRNAAGSNIGANWSVGSTGDILTVTRFISDVTGPGANEAMDFQIHCDAPVDFTFLRIIKNGGTHATW